LHPSPSAFTGAHHDQTELPPQGTLQRHARPTTPADPDLPWRAARRGRQAAPSAGRPGLTRRRSPTIAKRHTLCRPRARSPGPDWSRPRPGWAARASAPRCQSWPRPARWSRPLAAGTC